MTLTIAGAFAAGGVALAAPAGHLSRVAVGAPAGHAGSVPVSAPAGHKRGFASLPLKIKVIGRLRDGRPMLTNPVPTGLRPGAIAKVYSLSGLSATSGDGAGQIIAIVDAFHDPHALADLNKFNQRYGYPAMTTCTSLTQTGPCFEQVDPQGTPTVNAGWVLEESLDIEWAHAQAPAAKIVLVEAASNSDTNLFNAVKSANALGATEVSMSWGGGEFSGETTLDADFTHTGTFYTASAGDSGHQAGYPAASPNVIAVGGTTLNGCSGTSCAGFKNETTWKGSGGGASALEAIPADQSGYTGPVSGASTISLLTNAKRGIPDVSFDANPSTGVSVFDSTKYQNQSGWFTLGGTSVGAPNWAGILAAGQAAGKTALQGNSAIYAGGYSTNLRDITSGTNGTCGTDCTAGTGYDLVTGLGSPINYP
jgi:subtilase family serine protease